MGKRRTIRNKNSSMKPCKNDMMPTTEQAMSLPTDWFSSMNTQHQHEQNNKHPSIPISPALTENLDSDHNTPKSEMKLLDSDVASEHSQSTSKDNCDLNTEMSPSSGLKASSFYGDKSPSFQFGIRKTPIETLKQQDTTKKNGQIKGRNSKRKRTAVNNSKNHVAKRTKRDDSSFKSVVNGKLGNESHNGVIEKKTNGLMGNVNSKSDTASTILDTITPESSPSDKEIATTNGISKECHEGLTKRESNISSETHALNPTRREPKTCPKKENHIVNNAGRVESYCPDHQNTVENHIDICNKKDCVLNAPKTEVNSDFKTNNKTDIFEIGSQHSEDSLISGFGSINGSTLIKGDNGEYYFSNSNENSPDLTVNGPSQFFQTPTSSRSSPESISSLGSKERTMFLFGKDYDGSSYSPSGSSSNTTSPDHQISITTFFKSSTKQGNSVGSAKTNSLDRSKRSNKDKKKMEQMYLDLGQRNFGHVTCTTCGMVYTHAQPDDEIEHIRHHKKFVNGLRFNGWKDEHVVKEFSNGRIIMIKPDDHPSHQKKAEEIRKVVDSELGFAVDLPYRKNESKTFLFIAKRRVVGCCVATQIDKGYPVLPSTPNKDSTPDRQIAAWCCSTVPVPAQCGISKIWVWNQYRRKKVATRLIECVRTHFIYGCVISKDLLAFSDPTPDGKRLATAYIGTPEFLVFR